MSQSDPQEPRLALNPYEVSALEETQAVVEEQPSDEQRRYAIRMEWADRRRFLKAVGPLRIAAMVGAVSVVIGIWPTLSSIHLAWNWYQRPDMPPSMWIEILVRLIRNGVYGYVCWLQWQLADAIAKTAGGHDSSMQRWSEIQLRAAYMAIALIGLGILWAVWMSIEMFLIRRMLTD